MKRLSTAALLCALCYSPRALADPSCSLTFSSIDAFVDSLICILTHLGDTDDTSGDDSNGESAGDGEEGGIPDVGEVALVEQAEEESEAAVAEGEPDEQEEAATEETSTDTESTDTESTDTESTDTPITITAPPRDPVTGEPLRNPAMSKTTASQTVYTESGEAMTTLPSGTQVLVLTQPLVHYDIYSEQDTPEEQRRVMVLWTDSDGVRHTGLIDDEHLASYEDNVSAGISPAEYQDPTITNGDAMINAAATSIGATAVTVYDEDAQPLGELAAGSPVTVLTQPAIPFTDYLLADGTLNEAVSPWARMVLVLYTDDDGQQAAGYVDDTTLRNYLDNITEGLTNVPAGTTAGNTTIGGSNSSSGSNSDSSLSSEQQTAIQTAVAGQARADGTRAGALAWAYDNYLSPSLNPQDADAANNAESWDYWCLAWVSDGYGRAVSAFLPTDSDLSAYAAYGRFNAAELIVTDSNAAPAGAPIFFEATSKNGDYGHVAISSGQYDDDGDLLVFTTGWSGFSGIHVVSLSDLEGWTGSALGYGNLP